MPLGKPAWLAGVQALRVARDGRGFTQLYAFAGRRDKRGREAAACVVVLADPRKNLRGHAGFSVLALSMVTGITPSEKRQSASSIFGTQIAIDLPAQHGAGECVKALAGACQDEEVF